MSTSREATSLIDRVSCGVCMEQYDNNSHVPKILPCQHTFCLSCLKTLYTLNYAFNVECPVCRCIQRTSPDDFTTNRAVLDIVDELHNSPSTSKALKCSRHRDTECVLVCIGCLEGLCVKCIRQNTHKDHQLEDISDAKGILTRKSETMEEKLKLKTKLSLLQGSPCSATELETAEDDIRAVRDKLVTEIRKWGDVQLSILGGMKQKAVRREDEVQRAVDTMSHKDIDIEALLEMLKKIPNKEDSLPYGTKDMQNYSYVKECEELLQTTQSVLQTKESLSSKFLNQNASAKLSKGTNRFNMLLQHVSYAFILYIANVIMALFCIGTLFYNQSPRLTVECLRIVFCAKHDINYECEWLHRNLPKYPMWTKYTVWDFALFIFIVQMLFKVIILFTSYMIRLWTGDRSHGQLISKSAKYHAVYAFAVFLVYSVFSLAAITDRVRWYYYDITRVRINVTLACSVCHFVSNLIVSFSSTNAADKLSMFINKLMQREERWH